MSNPVNLEFSRSIVGSLRLSPLLAHIRSNLSNLIEATVRASLPPHPEWVESIARTW
ncbi:hypothetical protein [Aerosakkonema funiforme]|uniref:hypothetical protein n=1 Tax=Aerosakkonema funiforme TaxID=1246630 RepID=UPI0035BC5146